MDRVRALELVDADLGHPDRGRLALRHDLGGWLAALGCVDAVTVFSEDTPCAVLERIRPDIWVKGGDYDMETLAETALVRAWGGRALAIPFVAGYSTTALVRSIRGEQAG